jgi:glycerate kinase
MSDGGDGFGEVLARLLDVKAMAAATIDAAHRPRDAQWWWQSKKSIAIIESAQVIGLALLPPKRFHPFQLDTFGLGLVIQAALSQHPEQILIGIGGSATNDGGFGLARALGWKFLDGAGREISAWTKLESLHALVEAPGPPNLVRLLSPLMCKTLLGPPGASRIYGPQRSSSGRHGPCGSMLAAVGE